MSIKLDIN